MWTLITIDSENCDPKRLTPRQQLAYIAKRAGNNQTSQTSGSQLMSDFRPSPAHRRHVLSDSHLLHSENDEDGDEGMDSGGELMNEDLREIAGCEQEEESLRLRLTQPTDEKELLCMAEAGADLNTREEEEVCGGMEPPTDSVPSTLPADPQSYLAPHIAAFLAATSAIQQRRYEIFQSERALRCGQESS